MKPHVPGCSGKHKYATRELAEQVTATQTAKRGGYELYPYQCPSCHCWHLSRMSPERHEAILRAKEHAAARLVLTARGR